MEQGHNIIWKRMIYHGEDLGDYYLVSNNGEVKGVKTGKIRKKSINHEGYYFVSVSLGSRKVKPCIKIHRAVAETFLQNTNNFPVVNHKDGNKLNNNFYNLEWCTYKDNSIHAVDNCLTGKNIRIKCLNTGNIFRSIKQALKWLGKKNNKTLMKYLRENDIAYYGYHPITKEKLQWEIIED